MKTVPVLFDRCRSRRRYTGPTPNNFCVNRLEKKERKKGVGKGFLIGAAFLIRQAICLGVKIELSGIKTSS